MEPGCTLPEAPPYQPSPDGLDDIIALEITEVSPDLVVLQLKEDTLEGCGVEAYRDDGDGGEQGPVFIWEAMQRDDYSTQWRPPGATPVQSLTDGQIGEYCGMTVNSVAEEMYATYTIPETCFGNLELQFYPCDICEASFTDEQELERHVSDSHFISGAKRNELRGKAPSLICKEGGAPGQTLPFGLGLSQPKVPMRKTQSPPLQCVVCGRTFKQLKCLQRHLWYHTWRQGPSNSVSDEKQQPVTTGTQNPCPKCGRTFKERKMLDRHRRIYHHNQTVVLHRGRHHPDLLKNVSPLRCCECDRHFGTKETFYKHQCFHLRKQLRAFNASGRKSHGVNFYHCQLCALPFTGGLEFEHHIKVTHPEQYRKATRRIFSAGMTRSKRSQALKHRDKTVSLENAEAGFPPQTADPDEIPAITEQHDSEPVQLSYPCPECGKSFHMQALLNRHQKMYHIKAETRLHNGNNSYAHHKCTKCEKTFRTRRMLQKHKWMHRKKKDLTCCECRRCFGAAETFYKHKCFHLRKQLRAFNASGRKSHGVNFYHCQLCAIPFTGGLEFEHHIKVTHPEQYRKATRRIFSAGMTRSKRSRALKHRDKTVSLEGAEAGFLPQTADPDEIPAITEQQDSEPVQLSYPCPECGKSFHMQALLNRHQKMYHIKAETRLHNGNNSYAHHKCTKCEKAFRTRRMLEKHKQMHHKKKALTTRVKSEVEDKCAQTGDTRGSCSVATNTEEQGSGTSDLLHQCNKCGRIFQVRKMLDKHQRIYHRDQSTVLRRSRSHPTVSLLRCCECDRHFSTTESFHRHQCFHLRKQLRAFNASGRKSKGVNFFHCQLCTLQFTEGLKFELHVRVTHPEQYKKAARTRCSAGTTTKTGESGDGNNGKTYSKPTSVAKAHVKITRVKSEIEDKCAQTGDMGGSCSVATNIEERGSGTSDLLHQCGECGRIFKVRKMLDKHQRIYHRDQSAVLRRSRSHPTVNLLRCCECDRHFSTTESFHRHQCFHLRKQLRAFNASGRQSKGVNFFHCQLCTLQFTEGLKFELHVKVTHPEHYKKAARTRCSAGKTTNTGESGDGNNGMTYSKPPSVAKAHVKITRVKSEVEDKCAQTGVTRGSCSVATNIEERGSGTSDLLHQCGECGRIFKVRKMLDKHQRIYHRDHSAALRRSRSHRTVSLLRCCECDRHFSTTESFHRHQCFHLRKQLRAFNASGRKSKGVNFFHCQLCTLQFTEGLKFELHVKVTHPEQYKKAARTRCSAGKTTKTGESGVVNNIKTYSKPPSVAKAHVKITRVKSEVEDKCAQTGTTRDSCSVTANIEEQGSGTSDLLHQCGECGRIFKVRKMLDKHQRIYHRDHSAVLRRSRSHPTVSLLRCCECDRHFSTTESFHRHQCFHLRKQLRAFNASGRKSKGVNFFHCQLCTLQFTEGLKFELHVKVTHPEQYKKAARSKCSDGTTTKSDYGECFRRHHNLRRQQDSHTRIAKLQDCTERDRDLSCLKHLIQHQYVHARDPFFTCKVCGQRFHDPGQLRSHHKLHSEWAMYGYSCCEQKFGPAGDLHMHREGSHLGQDKLGYSACKKTYHKIQALWKYQLTHSKQ